MSPLCSSRRLAVLFPIFLTVVLLLTTCGGGEIEEPTDAARFLELARGEVEAGEYDIAAEMLDRALALKPGDMEALLLKAQVIEAQNDFLGAALAWELVTEVDPSNFAAYMSRADNYHKAAQTDRAISAFGDALGQRPDHPPAYVGRAEVRRIDGDVAGAIADLDRAIELDPRTVASTQLKPPSWLAVAFRERGLAHILLQGYDQALTDLNLAIGLDDRDAVAYASRGVVFGIQGNNLAVTDLDQALDLFARAVSDLDQAIRLQPDSSEHYANRAAAQGSLGRHVAAVEDFSSAINLDPSDSTPYVGRGQGYMELSQVVRANVDFERAVELNPLDATAYAWRAVAQGVLGNEEVSAADAERAEGLGFPRDFIDNLIGKYSALVSGSS